MPLARHCGLVSHSVRGSKEKQHGPSNNAPLDSLRSGCGAVLSACPNVALPQARAESPAEDDERILLDAGLSSDGPALLAFFQARARTGIDHEHLHRLMQQFVEGADEQRLQATEELLGLGPLALPIVRQTISEVDRPDVSARACPLSALAGRRIES